MDQPRSLFDSEDSAAEPAAPIEISAAEPESTSEPSSERLPDPSPAVIGPRLVARALDLMRGAPAVGVPVTFDVIGPDGSPTPLGTAMTDHDGRASPPDDPALDINYYRISFNVAHYFGLHGVDSCYPVIGVLVRVTDLARDFEVPLLFSASGYSTYHA
jgi:5-hydroxyisourate hydrolase